MFRMMHQDASAVEGKTLDRAVVRRVGHFARPYRGQLIGFIAMIAAGAGLALIPPLLFRTIIDTTIPDGNTAGLVVLGAVGHGVRVRSDRGTRGPRRGAWAVGVPNPRGCSTTARPGA